MRERPRAEPADDGILLERQTSDVLPFELEEEERRAMERAPARPRIRWQKAQWQLGRSPAIGLRRRDG